MLPVGDLRLETIGELRQYLRDTGARWQPDPRLRDSSPIPLFRTGGEPPSPSTVPPPLTPDGVLACLSRPSANPLVLGRRITQDVISGDSADRLLRAHVVPGGSEPGPLPNPLPTPPPLVDWRNRFGWSWITSVQTQLCCDCWCFSATALIESMVRIEHCVWFKGSENELRTGCNADCSTDGGDSVAIEYAIGNGLCDELCEPYTKASAVACADYSGRSVRLAQAGYVNLPSANASGKADYQTQKVWLDLNGPFGFFLDGGNLASWGNGSSNEDNVDDWPGSSLNHFVLCVGYDDSKGAWICKNSYGPAWNGDGFFYLEYGAALSENVGHSALYMTNPDPWTKRRLHNGAMVESGNGTEHRNFEFIGPGPDNALQHFWRDNDQPPFAWTAAEVFAENDAVYPPTFVESTYNRNYEIVYPTLDQRLHHWYFVQANATWNDGGLFGPLNVIGGPGFIQSNYGNPGNFEVVALNAYQQLEHWERDNSIPSQPWSKTASFGDNIAYSGASLIQSHYGTQGNFEFIAVLFDGQMQHWWRDNDDPAMPWNSDAIFGEAITSAPCMIEGMYGSQSEYAIGNFELVVAVEGNLQHWWRDNVGGSGWHQGPTFGDGHEVAVLALVESSFGFNLEVVAQRDDGHIQHYYRDPNLEWFAGEFIV
jgi:Papain family cysteine protease